MPCSAGGDAGKPPRRCVPGGRAVRSWGDSEVDMETAEDSPSLGERRRLGAFLRAGRDHQGLSLGDVAGQLKLRESFVQAIEEGRGDEHMAWSYERIHHRSIAAMLGIEMGEGS